MRPRVAPSTRCPWLWARLFLKTVQSSQNTRTFSLYNALTTPSNRWIEAYPPSPSMTCGWSTPRRSSAAAPGRPRSARIWPGGPSTGTAPPTRGSSGGSRCTWCARCTGCRSGGVLTGAKADEREVFWAIAESTPAIADMLAAGHRQTLIADKNYFGKRSKPTWTMPGSSCYSARPARARNPVQAPGSSSRYGRSSSPSTTPSRASSTSNSTAHAPSLASVPASASESWP